MADVRNNVHSESLSMVSTKEGWPEVHIKIWKSAAMGIPRESLLVSTVVNISSTSSMLYILWWLFLSFTVLNSLEQRNHCLDWRTNDSFHV